jgi:CubicO group peptidase (beta-lactamase class C family)
VLTHTSGLPNWRSDEAKPLRLLFTPGSKYNYSGEGFYFLQTVVESITAKSTAQFMRTTLDGLGMHASSYVWSESYAADSALPYGLDGKPMTHDTALLGRQLTDAAKHVNKSLEALTTGDVLAALPRLHPPQNPVPHNAMPNAAWSLLTTAGDYAKFVQALLNHPEHPMLRPALQLSRFVWRGLGVALQKRGSALAFFHTGANPGFKAVMFGDLTAKRGIVSFTNGQGGFVFNMHALEKEMGDQPAVFYLEEP